MWGRQLDQRPTDSFENLSEFVETSDSGATTVILCLKEHISSLSEKKKLAKRQCSVYVNCEMCLPSDYSDFIFSRTFLGK